MVRTPLAFVLYMLSEFCWFFSMIFAGPYFLLKAWQKKLLAWSDGLLFDPPRPLPTPTPLEVPTAVAERGVSGMADVLVYSVELPAIPEWSDTVTQELKVIAGGSEQVLTFSKDKTVAENVEVPQDAEVRLELRYIDDAGNRSEPGVLNFTARDTIPPDAPGPFGAIMLVSEHEAPPVAEPSPAPEDPPAPVEDVKPPPERSSRRRE